MEKTLDLGSLTPEEIIAKVRSGEIPSCEYKTSLEYLKAMEMP